MEGKEGSAVAFSPFTLSAKGIRDPRMGHADESLSSVQRRVSFPSATCPLEEENSGRRILQGFMSTLSFACGLGVGLYLLVLNPVTRSKPENASIQIQVSSSLWDSNERRLSSCGVGYGRAPRYWHLNNLIPQGGGILGKLGGSISFGDNPPE